MKKLLTGVSLISVLLGTFFISVAPSSAHQSGCHRWHSCPSDTGSYVCGDLGYTSDCPIPSPTPEYVAPTYTPPVVVPKPAPVKPLVKQNTQVKLKDFVGKPKTYAQLYSCRVVGNFNSKIYHLKGSRYIKEMNLKNKECFSTETAAKAKGLRKARAQ